MRPSARRRRHRPTACWLVRRRPETQDEHDAAPIAQLKAPPPEGAAAIVFAQDFAQLVRERRADQLDSWLARAADSPFGPVQRFATGLRDDDAVTAGLTLRWSNGPVEAPINRLKMGRRQLFGRASLDLLQRRVLLAA